MSKGLLDALTEVLVECVGFLTHPLTRCVRVVATLFGYFFRPKTTSDVPANAGIMDPGPSHARRAHDGRPIVGRKRVFEVVDKTRTQRRRERESFSLLLFEVERRAECIHRDLITNAFQHSSRGDDVFGRIGNTYVIGIRCKDKETAITMLKRAVVNLLDVVSPESLRVGLGHDAEGKKNAFDLYKEALVDLRRSISSLEPSRGFVKRNAEPSCDDVTR